MIPPALRSLLVLFLCSIGMAFGADKAVYANSFTLTLTYQSENAGRFVVVLKNSSKAKLDLMLNTHEVEGEFLVFEGNKKVASFYDRDYLRKAGTSVWYPGSCELQPDAEIRWNVSLDEVTYLEGGSQPVTSGSLVGKVVSLKLNKLAVFPAPGKSCVYVEVRSNAVEIAKIEQAGAGQPATAPESKPEGSDKPQPELKPASR